MLSKKLSLLVLPLVATLSLQANDPFNDPFFQDPFGDEIFKEMMQMQKNMDKMFSKMHNRMQQRSTRLISPLGTYKIAGQNSFVDKNDHYELMTTIPQSKENEIDINIKDGVMYITAKIVQKRENKTANSYSTSSSVRMYQQSMSIPKDADEGGMKADYKDGKLVITLQKKKEQKSNPVDIKSKKKSDINGSKESNKSKVTIQSDLPSMS